MKKDERKLLNNPWIIGVGTTILVYLISFVIPKIFNDGKDQKIGEILLNRIHVPICIIILLPLISVFLYMLFFKLKFKYKGNQRESDIALFEEIRSKYFNQDTNIRFLRDYNFRGAFIPDNIHPISEFQYKCKNSDFKFINPRLERLRSKLASIVENFLNLVALNTFPEHNDYQSVPREWERKDKKRFEDAVNNLNNCADDICDIYDNLIKLGRKYLEI